MNLGSLFAGRDKQTRATGARAATLVGCLLAFFYAAYTGGATDHFATNLTQLKSLIGQALPGDRLTMANGSWTNADILFKRNGAPDKEITLRAQTPGQVFLTGASRLRIAGSYLVVDGLTFKQGYLTSGDVIAFREDPFSQAVNCRLSNCAIVDYNPPTTNADVKWVSLYGFSNRVDHCFFQGKQNKGALLVVWLPSAISPDAAKPNFHRIDHNYIGQRPVVGGNDGEAIRIGDAVTSFDISHTIVEANYFDECNGEIEIISNKSCENVYRHNTFVNCEGALTLRHGNRCTVEGNFFFGNGRPRTGGVRIIGEDHKVFNNYFQDLAGADGRAPLSISQGLVDSPRDGYFQVKNAIVAFNTFVNCGNGLLIGLPDTLTGTSQQTTLPPFDCRIANNLVFSTHKKLVDQRITPVNLTWEGNLMFGTSLGISAQAGITLADPKLVEAADRLWRPATDSPALGAALGDYSFVTTDVDGQDRPALKDAGCDQASAGPVTQRPLTNGDVGPAWMALSASADGSCQAPVPNILSVVSVNACSVTNAITVIQSPVAGTLVGLGAHTITVTATDEAGNSATCTTIFTVTDTTAPSVSCSAIPVASADGACQAAVPNVLADVTVSDSCSGTNAITVTQSPVAGTLVGSGTNTITVTATDEAGNSATCTTIFTVTDTTAPSVSCSAIPAASADGACQAAVPNVLADVTVSDSCSGTNRITVTQSPVAGTLVGLGTNTITVTATDEAGNSATCTTIFTVTDTTAPSVNCSAIPAASADGACQAAVPNVLADVTVSDSCSGTNGITVAQSPVAGTLVGLGTNTITVTATDAAGNSATCTTIFTVTDTAAPSVSCSAIPAASADGACQAAVPNVLADVTVSDSCSGTNAITVTQSPVAGTLVGLGTNTITVTATDAAGNSATCTTIFTLSDTTAPSVNCSALPAASADGACRAAVPNVLADITVSDSCSGTNAITVTQSPVAGTLVGLGTHTITVTATDAAGNSATCTTIFTVTDTTAPSVSCSTIPAASADGACQAAVPNVLADVTVSDSCSGTNAITVTQSPVAGTLVGLGTHTITVTATDAAGNSATCTTIFTVTDTTAPSVSCSAIPAASADGACQAAVPNVLADITVSDSCSGTNAITVTQSPVAGTLVGLGTHTITVTATDAAGNSATCTTIFTVSCSALSLQAAEYDGQHFTLQWNAVPGVTCQVQSSADLVNWLDAGPSVAGSNFIQRWTDDGSSASPGPTGSPRFYRVKQLPAMP